jgi:DNA-binding NtrC family response regulator
MNLFRVLCVGNDLSLLLCLRNGLGRFGIEITTAIHGEDAENQFQDRASGLGSIVIDHDMATAKAACFAQLVRNRGFNGRIIVLSSCDKVPSLEVLKPLRIYGFCSKPVVIGELLTMLLQSE